MTDHAAKNETSISMHVAGSLVDLSVFKEATNRCLPELTASIRSTVLQHTALRYSKLL